MLVFVLVVELAGALPFVTTWRTTQANESIVLPLIRIQPDQQGVNISWGDGAITNEGCCQFTSSHNYDTPGLHNVSIDGPFFWTSIMADTKEKLVDIASWGDGFLVQGGTGSLFQDYSNLQVSAPPDTQPVFLPGATLQYMFRNSSFNSSLNWDLTNVTSLDAMFANTPLNQPITFRSTQGVSSARSMFENTPYFNQPIHFDASGLSTVFAMLRNASSFNQVVNLTNATRLSDTSWMFAYASSFNQPITFNLNSVGYMDSMFAYTTKFNQPITLNSSQALRMEQMFVEADAFNQPINFNTPNVTTTKNMFYRASSFNQPVVMDTSSITDMSNMFGASFASTVTFTSTAKVTDMGYMFFGATGFKQDLSSWDTQHVTRCDNFCPQCGLPAFPSCVPCPVRHSAGQLSVCSSAAPSALSWAVLLLPSSLVLWLPSFLVLGI